MPRAPDLSGIALDGRYELHAVIGEGTFGRVYRGRDRRLARRVAVKVIKPWWAEDPDWVKTFEREAQLLASISDPGIVQIFDVGSAPEGLYYVAELVDGESLAGRLRSGPLSPSEACDVAGQLARALASAHARRVVHRDVKPANVLISHDGRIKVGDFGVAHLAEGSSDGAGATIAGTPRYMAPEQARGEPTTPATDVYGVGIVLYEMLAGHAPFEGTSSVELALKHVHDPPPPLPAATPQALVDVVERALAKRPSDRYGNGAVLAEALEDARGSLAEDREHLASTGAVALLAPPVSSWRASAPPAGAPPVRPPPGSRAPARPRANPRGRDRRPIAQTVFQEPMSRRHNVNPSERRRRIGLIGCVLLLAGGMLTGAIALARGHLNVPKVLGMTRGPIRAKAHRMDFRVAFSYRNSRSPKGAAIAQSPAPGVRVNAGTAIGVVLSAGPAPVTVPKLVGKTTQGAEALLGALKLRDAVTQVPAPGMAPGTVTQQSPAPGAKRIPGSKILLSAAETPQLRLLTSFAGDGSGRSLAFRIRGTRWQLISGMSYQGTCTFIFVCSGPTATVTDLHTGKAVDQFDLPEGSNQARTVKSGPGLYQLSISPGSDTAHWSIKLDDYY